MKEKFLLKADHNLPPLLRTEIRPDLPRQVMKKGDRLVIDLGNHYVGYFSFKLWWDDVYLDAPVRITFRFLETERELADDFSTYSGTLCRSWLQDETVNVLGPGPVQLSRRYAARFVELAVDETPRNAVLSDFCFTAETSADPAALLPFRAADPRIAEIDRVSVNTLKNCMQRVFEDGPKRDRRLWIGDLRLEALTSYYTWNNPALVRRCLYLFAAADRNAAGFLPGYVFEDKMFVSGYWFLRDYSLMYVCTLCDYYENSGDLDTFTELLPVAKDMLAATAALLDENGLLAEQRDTFVDWCRGLEKRTAFNGIYLYTLDLFIAALKKAGLDASEYEKQLIDGRAAARKHLYNEELHAFVNSYDKEQNSVHSAAWMVLAGVLTNEEARDVLRRVMADPDSVKPFTPYMHHYAVDAMLSCGLRKEAEDYMMTIWGGMLDRGADTFFEAYVPEDPDFSPYNDRMMNSMCHAWSCTPSYFIRKYGFGNLK
ncbi:MAG: hypothetical protein IJC53_07505 [Clostridia bacterium]|nr:hypothetical protein [Clostridia bacterium]